MQRLPRRTIFTFFITAFLVGMISTGGSWGATLIAMLFLIGLPMAYMAYTYYYPAGLTMQGKIRDAIKHYDRVLNTPLLPMNRTAIHMRRASLHNALGDVDKAIDDYSAAMKKEDDNPALFAIRSALYLSKRDFEKALADSDKLLTLRPDSEVGYANRAAAKMFLGDLNGAIDDCTQGLEQNISASGKALLYNNRGTAYRMNGDFTEAMASYNLAMSAGLNDRERLMIHPSIITNQGILYHIQQKYADAKAYFSQALGINPSFYKSTVGLAAAQYKMGKVPEAQKLWMDLIHKEPRYRSPLYLQKDLNLPMQVMSDVDDLIESMTV